MLSININHLNPGIKRRQSEQSKRIQSNSSTFPPNYLRWIRWIGFVNVVTSCSEPISQSNLCQTGYTHIHTNTQTYIQGLIQREIPRHYTYVPTHTQFGLWDVLFIQKALVHLCECVRLLERVFIYTGTDSNHRQVSGGRAPTIGLFLS